MTDELAQALVGAYHQEPPWMEVHPSSAAFAVLASRLAERGVVVVAPVGRYTPDDGGYYVDHHEPGDEHDYRIVCVVCGERGTVRVSIEPQTGVGPAIAQEWEQYRDRALISSYALHRTWCSIRCDEACSCGLSDVLDRLFPQTEKGCSA